LVFVSSDPKSLRPEVCRCPGTPALQRSSLDPMKTFHHLPLFLFLASLISSASPAQGKPLSYVGGTMVMQENDETGHTLNIDYTFDPHFALGLYSKYEIGGDEISMEGTQTNTPLKRWIL